MVLETELMSELEWKKNSLNSTLCAAWIEEGIAKMPKLNAAKRSKGVAFLDIWAWGSDQIIWVIGELTLEQFNFDSELNSSELL